LVALGSSFLLCGDVDSNGLVEEADAQLVARAILGTVRLTESQRLAADVAPPVGDAGTFGTSRSSASSRAAIARIVRRWTRVPLKRPSCAQALLSPWSAPSTALSGRVIRFRAQGMGIAEISVHVFNLAGNAVRL
jgi:hypothetical protein